MRRTSLLTVVYLLSFSLYSQFAVVSPAEFEKNDGLFLVWNYNPPHDSIAADLIAVVPTSIDNWIIYDPAQNGGDTVGIRQFLLDMGIQSQAVHFLAAWTNTPWIRSYGPWINYGVFTDQPLRYMADAAYGGGLFPMDDSLPSQLAGIWNWPHDSLHINLDGRNLQFDGLMRGFTSRKVMDDNQGLTENEIKNYLMDEFNVMDVVFMDKLEYSGGGSQGGIDLFMKVLDYETILVSSIPESLPDYEVLESNVALLSQLQTRFGSPYKIIRVASPPNSNGQYPISQEEECRSYTNMLQLNNTIIMPTYHTPEYDEAALSVMEDALPGYEVFGVDARFLSSQHASFHSMTKEIPQTNFLQIYHPKVSGPQIYFENYNITCLSNAMEEVEAMWLYYKLNQDSVYTKTTVHLVCPQHVGVIEALLPTDTIHYYLEAISTSEIITYPLSAPEGNFSFWFDMVGENEIQNTDKHYQIMPNPNAGRFTISLPHDNSKLNIKVMDASGSVVFQRSETSEPRIQLPNSLNEGVYLLHIEDGHGSHTSKMILNYQ